MKRRSGFYLVSLGCPKNLVDSEGMATLLQRAGLLPAASPERAEVLIVNTCGFIAPARAESLAALRELAAAKRPGQVLVAAGCYAERSPEELAQALPGIDGLIGTRRWPAIVELVERLRAARSAQPLPLRAPCEANNAAQEIPGLPRAAVQGGSAHSPSPRTAQNAGLYSMRTIRPRQ